jgi:hypothetical protein
MKQRVSVFILVHGAPHRSHVSHLNSLFNDHLFNVELKAACSLPLEDRIMNCLKESWRNDPEAYTLVLTDRILSPYNGRTVADIIKKCIQSGNFDLAYLFKYHDKCQMHKEIGSHGSVSIVDSQSPRGLEAILYSPCGRNIILKKRSMRNKKSFNCKKGLEATLHKNIYDGNLRCIATSPNLFQYDTMNNAISYTDYMYRNECIPIQLAPPPAIVSSSRILIVLAFIFILIVITAWALLQIQTKK